MSCTKESSCTKSFGMIMKKNLKFSGVYESFARAVYKSLCLLVCKKICMSKMQKFSFDELGCKDEENLRQGLLKKFRYTVSKIVKVYKSLKMKE